MKKNLALLVLVEMVRRSKIIQHYKCYLTLSRLGLSFFFWRGGGGEEGGGEHARRENWE